MGPGSNLAAAGLGGSYSCLTALCPPRAGRSHRLGWSRSRGEEPVPGLPASGAGSSRSAQRVGLGSGPRGCAGCAASRGEEVVASPGSCRSHATRPSQGTACWACSGCLEPCHPGGGGPRSRGGSCCILLTPHPAFCRPQPALALTAPGCVAATSVWAPGPPRWERKSSRTRETRAAGRSPGAAPRLSAWPRGMGHACSVQPLPAPQLLRKPDCSPRLLPPGVGHDPACSPCQG